MDFGNADHRGVPVDGVECRLAAKQEQPAQRPIGPKWLGQTRLRRPLYEANPAACFALDEHAVVLSCSQYAGEQLGYGVEELLDRSFLTVSHPDDRHEVSKLVRNCLRRPGEMAQAELRKTRRDGSLLWVHERQRAVTGDDGELVVLVVWEDVTERRVADKAVRESEAKYRAIVEAVDGLIYVCSPEYRIEFMNRQLIERTGRDATGELCYKALHNLDSMCSWCVNDRVARGETVRWELQSPKDGRWYYVVDTPICHTDGSISKQAIIQDITERKLSNEARLRGITDSAQDAIVMMDARGNISFWNPAAESILGYQKDEAMGKNLHQLLVPQRYLGAHLAAFPEFLRSGRGNVIGKTVELHARRKDGSEIAIDLSLSAIPLDGEWHAIGIIRDITERKRAEQVVRDSEEKFRQLAENVREVFFVLTANSSQTLYVSPAYEQIWGRSRDTLYRNSMSWLEAIDPVDRERIRTVTAKRLEGDSIELEYRIRTPAGEEKWIRSRSFPVLDQSGELTRIVGIAEEITDQKHYQAELIRAREAAEAANRAKSVFLATMSHELRTPLNAILGFTELLELEMSDRGIQDWQSDLQKIRKAGNHLMDLISDVMDLSKIEAGKMDLQPIDFDMGELVREVVASVEPVATKNSVEVEVVCDPVILHSDRLRVRQCLFNLVGNACKFTHDGKVLVEAKPMASAGQQWYVVRVADTGIGIQAEDLGKLFSDFTQVDASTTRKYGGTGMGLAISRKLSRLMGGDITVESAAGLGSTFTLHLPTVAPQREQTISPVPDEAPRLEGN